MKFVLKLALVTVMFNSCAPNRYLINGDTKTDQKFLVDEIKKAKSNKEISSKTPLIVLDGKPYRYDYELKNETITVIKDKKEIKKYTSKIYDGVIIIIMKK